MRAAPFALAAACLLTLFLGLDTVGYLDAREARDARVAEEVRSAREPLTPLFGHEPLFDKPMAGYLPELLTHDSVAESPVASRLLRAGIAVLLVLVTTRIGMQQFGARAGFLAGMVLTSSVVLPMAARGDAAQLMATLAAWLALAIFAGRLFPAAGVPDEAARPRGAFLAEAPTAAAHLALAFAALVAGPLPALWPLGAAALYARLSRHPHALAPVRPLAALVVIAGVSLVWYAPMAERHGAPFLAHLAFFPYGANPAGGWWVGAVLTISLMVAATFPWCTMLPAAIAHAALRWRKSLLDDREEREERASHFLVACLVVSLAPIAFYPSPPITAALPAAPAVALLCGRFLDHLLEDPARLRGVFARSNLMLGAIATMMALTLSMAGSRLTVLFPGIRWLAPFARLSGWAPFLVHYFLRRTGLAVVLVALPVVAGLPLVSARLLPQLEDFMSARRAAEAMNAVSPERAPLALLEDAPATLRLYLARNAVRIDSIETLPALRARDGYAYLAYRPAREKETAVRLGSPLEVLSRTPTLVLARTPVAAATGR